VRDRVFEGESLEAALAQASHLFGVTADRIRYVRLETAGPGVRIAVLGGWVSGRPGPERSPASHPESAIHAVVDALSDAVGASIHKELRVSEASRPTLRLSGPGCAFLVDGDTGPLRALEHVLQRSGGPGTPRLTVECEGYREGRERELRALAEELACRARERGEAQEAPWLNAYERRLVHIALATEPGLRTFSRGNGSERRLVVAPSEPAAGPPSSEEPS
jgi:spoIIIJ-associated protein